MTADSFHNVTQRPRAMRRKYLLDAGFQLRYVFGFAGLGGGGVALVGGLAYGVHRAVLEQGATPEVLASSGQTLLWLTVLGAVGVALVLGLFGLVLTHRVAGPVHVMTLYVSSLAAGRYPRLRSLRKGDELRSFFARFSEAVERIRDREADEARLLAGALNVLAPLATTPDAREAIDSLASLQARKRQAFDGPSSGASKP
jgi:hypothetical protein